MPLVSAYTLSREKAKITLVDTHEDERYPGVQFVGKEPLAMGEALRQISRERRFSWVNLNCGCPSTHTVGSGGGSALLGNPKIIAEAVRALRDNCPASVRLSVKIRLKDGADGTLGICKLIEEEGADFIIIHGRTPAQGYSGKADWGIIREIRGKLGIPVIGNGDISCAAEGKKRMEDGYCDGYMIGRAAMGNPMAFCDREPQDKWALLDEYIALSGKYLGSSALQDVKLKALSFMCGLPMACALRNRIAKAKSVDEIIALKGDDA